MENNNLDIEKKVMEEIQSGRVKLRSKYIFVAEKLGVGSAFVLSAVLAILFFNLIFYYLKTSDNLEYLSFGSVGILAFLESFPYLLVFGLIIFTLIISYLIKKSGVFYKRSLGLVIVVALMIIIFTGTALAFTGLAEKIEKQSAEENYLGTFMRPFFGQNWNKRNKGIVGRVVYLEKNYFIIQTPMNTKQVFFDKMPQPVSFNLEVGQWVLAVGELKSRDVFIAHQIKMMDNQDMPMVQRIIHRRFGNFSSSSPNMVPEGGCMREYENHPEDCKNSFFNK